MIDPIDRNTALSITEECAKTLKWILSDEDLSESERKECEWKLDFAESIISDLKNVPSVMLEPEPCEDAVSRQRLLNDLKELIAEWKKYPVMAEQIKGVETTIGYVETIPSVTPKQKTGKWINNIHDLPVCDQCGYMTPYDRAIDDYEYGNFCPNCGAKMEEG